MKVTDVRSGDGGFPEDYTYERRSGAGFDETLGSITHAIESRDLVVRRTYDIQSALEAKGFPIQPLTILEVGRAHDSSSTELAGLLTPLRFNVYQRGDHVFVSALRPSFVTRLVSDDAVVRLAACLERDVLAVVDAAAGDGT
ncbi:MAG: DUF302 domain-containing protein [Coriobacteriia bacterium]|nr:DUF302 domain-containing protein [Coriobacteriia bacterium]